MTSLEQKFGELRCPTKVDTWENRSPNSLVKLTTEVGSTLKNVMQTAQTQLMSAALQSINLLWVVDHAGEVWICVEELALIEPETGFIGFPRRRGFRVGVDQKKLGHPTLLHDQKSKQARIAGELIMDKAVSNSEDNGPTCNWVLNANSGRYCAEKPPTPSQLEAVATKFAQCGVAVEVDEIF